MHVVSCSNCETEFRDLATTTKEIVHVRRLLVDFTDNQSVVKIAINPVFHERMEHIEIDCYFTRQYFTSATISLPYIRSDEQIAEFFTKLHTTVRFGAMLDKLILFDPPWV